MSFKRQSVMCCTISSLMFIALLMSLGYTLSRRYNRIDIPYGLSSNFVKFVNESSANVKFDNIIAVDTDKNITVIGEHKGQDFITLYDPRYYFYNQKMITAIGVTRYFSDTDYRQQSKTGILVSDKNLFEGFSDTANINSKLIDECIFHINSYSTLYKPNINFIINLTSVKYLGDVIYIDYDVYEEYQKIEEKLIENGYKVQSTKNLKPINLIGSAIKNHNIYEISLILTSLSMYPIFLFATTIFFYNNNKLIYINKICGGYVNKVFSILSRSFLVYNCCITTIIAYTTYSIYSSSLLIHITLLDTSILLMLHLLITHIFYLIGFAINYYRLELGDGNKYVK